MNWLKTWIISFISGVVFAAAPPGNTGIGDEKIQRCTYHKAFGMHGAHCSGLNLHGVPKILKSNIQILDLSYNRIRTLRNSTFQRYTYLRFIYLNENMIQNIEAGTFDPIPNIETLDLSINALTTIPEFILNLPSLRRLYLTDNNLYNLNSDLKTMSKPFLAPLNFLNIAKCQLKEFPDFGIMPEVDHLNASSNEFRNLSPRNFATFCGVTQLDLTSAMYSQDFCTFKVLTEWFRQKEVTLLPDIDAIFNSESEDAKHCNDVQFSEDDIKLYTECRSTVKTRVIERNAKKTWTIIAASVGGSLIVFVILLFWVHRRNVRKTKKNNKLKEDNHNRVIENLLNDIS